MADLSLKQRLFAIFVYSVCLLTMHPLRPRLAQPEAPPIANPIDDLDDEVPF